MQVRLSIIFFFFFFHITNLLDRGKQLIEGFFVFMILSVISIFLKGRIFQLQMLKNVKSEYVRKSR